MPLPPLGTELSQTFRHLMEDLERQHLAELSGHTVSESVSMQHAQCPDSCRIGPTPSNVIGSLIRSHAHYLISCHCFTRLQHNIQFINLVIWFSHLAVHFNDTIQNFERSSRTMALAMASPGGASPRVASPMSNGLGGSAGNLSVGKSSGKSSAGSQPYSAYGEAGCWWLWW